MLNERTQIISSDCNHSSCKIVSGHSGVLLIKKQVDASIYNVNPKELVELYSAYRDLITAIFPIPKLIDIIIRDQIIIIIEELIVGLNGEQIILEGDLEKIKNMIRVIFTQLSDQIIKINGRDSISFPINTPIDVKPANILVANNRVVTPVDFFPPLIKSVKTQKYIHAKNMFDQRKIEYSYGDFEVLLAKFYFEIKKISPFIVSQLRSIFLEMISLTQSQVAIDRFSVNVFDSSSGCPNCSYCNKIH